MRLGREITTMIGGIGDIMMVEEIGGMIDTIIMTTEEVTVARDSTSARATSKTTEEVVIESSSNVTETVVKLKRRRTRRVVTHTAVEAESTEITTITREASRRKGDKLWSWTTRR